MPSITRPPKMGRWSEPALRVLRERYLAREQGQVRETPEEMCWRGALALPPAGNGFGGSPAGGSEGGAAFHDQMGGGAFLPHPPPPQHPGQGNARPYSALHTLPARE